MITGVGEPPEPPPDADDEDDQEDNDLEKPDFASASPPPQVKTLSFFEFSVELITRFMLCISVNKSLFPTPILL